MEVISNDLLLIGSLSNIYLVDTKLRTNIHEMAVLSFIQLSSIILQICKIQEENEFAFCTIDGIYILEMRQGQL